jgi:hypothetical protein
VSLTLLQSARIAQASALNSNTTDNGAQTVANSLIDAFSTNTVTAAAKALKDLITLNTSVSLQILLLLFLDLLSQQT